MLSYNDAYHQPSQPQSDASCIVCHDLTPAERIIWHEVKLDLDGTRTHVHTQTIVPICVDCADLFHDVSEQPSTTR
jgi:hypothetical protein